METMPKDHALAILIFCDLSVAEYERLKRTIAAQTSTSLPPYAQLQGTKGKYLPGSTGYKATLADGETFEVPAGKVDIIEDHLKFASLPNSFLPKPNFTSARFRSAALSASLHDICHLTSFKEKRQELSNIAGTEIHQFKINVRYGGDGVGDIEAKASKTNDLSSKLYKVVFFPSVL